MKKIHFFLIIIFLILSLRFFLKSSQKRFLKQNSFKPKNSPSPQFEKEIPPLSLERIFQREHLLVNNLPQKQTLTLITTGDVIPARSVNYKMHQYQDFSRPFLKTAQFLKSADLTLINLESPLIASCPITNEGMVFCSDQRFIQGLLFADIDIANLANNHILNYGFEGLKQTIELLNEKQIAYCGAGDNLAIKKIKNFKIGFLGWNFLEKFNKDEIINKIRNSKKEVDFLVVSCHWGAEYQALPSWETITLAHQLIEAGADIVAGNHPHWIQPLEIYQEKLIIYAHGNFIFDQEWSKETKTGYLVKTTFCQKKICDAEIFPIFISDYHQADFLKDEKKEEVLLYLYNLSLELKKKYNQPSFD